MKVDMAHKATAVALSAVLTVGMSPSMAMAVTGSDTSSDSAVVAVADNAQGSGLSDSTDASGGSNGTPPAPPSDGNGQSQGGTPPAPPSGGNAPQQGGTPPEKPSGDSSQPRGGNSPDGDEQAQGGQPGGSGADTMTFDYSGTYTAAKDADGSEEISDGETITATQTDQNAVLAQNGASLTVTNGMLEKSGDDTNGDNCNFYGLNSIATAVGEESQITISDSSLNATSEGSNGIFSTDNATVWASNDTITTSAGNSRGLDATYGGMIIADSMTIATKGEHCASLATDRGGGSISVANSKLSTAGSGSPLLYSTGDIEVSNVEGTASGSQIAGMEGLNSIYIENSTLESTITGKTASDPVANGVIIYQSTSGDAESTTGDTATFEACGSTLKSSIESGSMFYLTNTSANVVLQDSTLDFDSDKANLITAAGNGSNNWGTAGSNGATVSFTGIGEELSGDIEVDTISSLDLYLLKGSTYKGATSVTDNESATSKSESPITANVDGTSTWTVTEDSIVTNLNAEDGAKIVDEDGKTVTIVVDGETKVQGDSTTTLTVTGSYSTEVVISDQNKISGASIDRTGFDECFDVSTAFESVNVDADAASSGGGFIEAILDFFSSLFG